MSLKKVIEAVRKNKSFFITSHINPEADAIGSQLAFKGLLLKLNKEAFICDESKPPGECLFLPGIDSIHPAAEIKKNYGCAVFLDCADLSRAGRAGALGDKCETTLNIDHHISNSRFAGINWASARYSCTCEMVYRLYKEMRVPIDKAAALQLYAGLVVDTGSFRFNNTNSFCHSMASDLVSKGIPVYKAYNSLYTNNSFNDIKLLGEVLSTAQKDHSGRICWVSIPKEILKQASLGVDFSEAVLSQLRSIKGLELAVVFKEVLGKGNKLRVNLRSQSFFDCNALAGKFQGGGHKNASGATIEGNPENIRKEVIRQAQRMMRKAIM